METMRRPSSNDTEEDLFRMQKEMFERKCKKQTLVNNNSFAEKSRQIDKLAGHFCLNLDSLAEKDASIMQLTIRERNVEFLYNADQLDDCKNSTKCENYAEEEGFPDVLDLSRYYNGLDESVKNIPANGRSFFAIEFDRIHGRIGDYSGAEASTSVAAKSMNDISREIELENLQRIEKMSKQEIEKAKQEIVERFDPKVLDFLRNKAKKERQWNAKLIERVPQQIEKSTGETNNVISDVCTNMNQEVANKIKELEIFGLERNNSAFHKDPISKLDDTYMRLAADVAQMDMATKCIRTILPRQQQNIIRLFDNLRTRPKNYIGDDDLLEMARNNLNAIKGLYLEQRKDKDGNLSVHFAEGIDPFGKAAWMLSPICKVLDVMQKDGKSTAHDLVIVRLSLFWTLLVMVERPTLYYAFATPSEIFVRLAEIFIMGPEIFKDECVSRCLSRFLHDYLEPKARDGLLHLALKEPVAGLDSFRSFYEDLLHHFEEFSMGDENFTLFILHCAYANQRLLDSLLMKCAIWTSNRNIVRQMILKKDSGGFLLNLITARQMNDNEITDSKYFTQFGKLLLSYAAAIRDGIIMKNRNELVYEIASSELGYYIRWYMTRNVDEKIDMEMVKQYDTLVFTLRQSLAGYLEL